GCISRLRVLLVIDALRLMFRMRLNVFCDVISMNVCREKIYEAILPPTAMLNCVSVWRASWWLWSRGICRTVECRQRLNDEGVSMGLFPLFLSLEGRRCIVVGAGNIAESKIR